MSLLFNMLSGLVTAFLPSSKYLLISWVQSPSAVILEPPKIKSLTVSIVSPSIWYEVTGPGAMIFVFWMLSFKPTFSLSSFTFIQRLSSSSSFSALRMVSSVYLRFQIGKGVHQGCILLSCLFNLHAEYIMQNAGLDEAQPGIKIARRNINSLQLCSSLQLLWTFLVMSSPLISLDETETNVLPQVTRQMSTWVSGEKWKSLSPNQLFVTPWTIRPMEFSRSEYWSG